MLSSGLVVYYISEYSSSSVEKTKSVLNKLSTQEILFPEVPLGEGLNSLAENLPIGTVICIEMSNEKSRSAYVCLPMFASHISLPLKPGEVVWFYKDVGTFDEATKTAHPILSLTSYWLSRKIGSRISEDLSFTFISRDVSVDNNSQLNKDLTEGMPNVQTNDKKLLKQIKSEESRKIRLPDYTFSDTYIEKHPFLNNNEYSNLYEDSKNNFDVFPRAVPRWNSKSFELSLQGSNNSLINLTKSFVEDKEHESSGAIDLVAGRHMLEDFTNYLDDDFYTINNKIVQNQSDISKREVEKLSINTKKSYLKVKNINGDDEVLKGQKPYLGEEFKSNNLNLEGESNFKNDASRIYISEFDNLDNSLYYSSNKISILNVINFDSDKVKLSFVTKDYLIDESSIIGENFSLTKINNNKFIVPSILLKSNDIRIIARKSESNSEKTLEEGSIRIIKESNNFYESACLLLEKSGQVLIDGSTIQVGNFQKEVQRQNIDITDENQVKKMSGEGYGVLIGYEPTLSEPLVLGNTLESMLKEMMHINIKLIEEIKKLTDDLASHTHIGIPITGVSGPPQIPTPYTNFSNTSHNDIKNRYESLQNNLKDMLSKFAKTS